MIHPWVRERHERLAAIITLADRLVTAAIAVEVSVKQVRHERLLRAANGCDLMRHAFGKMQLPASGQWVTLADEQNTETVSSLTDIERTLDEMALAVPHRAEESGQTATEKRSLFVPDAFDNPEHVRFAIKGALAALICYVAFVGFDYPGIYTSVITCFVVSLTTIGASNQKGILRFGGAAVGGLMGLIALVYLFPNVDIGGFWLVFGAGTAVAAWANFGTPRISYGGYQVGLAFYKAVLQDFGPAGSATVVRDRLIGIFFGLIVFGVVEHLLWPVRAQDALRARLAEMLDLLAELARSATANAKSLPSSILDHQSSAAKAVTSSDVESWRRRISQKVRDVQGLIESSKFESGNLEVDEIQKRTGDGQLVFVLLLSLARDSTRLPDAMRAAAFDLDTAVATTLEAMATQLVGGSRPAVPDLDGSLDRFERSMTGTDALDSEAAGHLAARLGLYRALVAAVKQISSGSMRTAQDRNEAQVFAAEKTLAAEQK
jgi:multidrug resistance protein MdtO